MGQGNLGMCTKTYTGGSAQAANFDIMTNLFDICKYRVLASILGIGKLSGICQESVPQTGIVEKCAGCRCLIPEAQPSTARWPNFGKVLPKSTYALKQIAGLSVKTPTNLDVLSD
jgi:hypothetical protein